MDKIDPEKIDKLFNTPALGNPEECVERDFHKTTSGVMHSIAEGERKEGLKPEYRGRLSKGDLVLLSEPVFDFDMGLSHSEIPPIDSGRSKEEYQASLQRDPYYPPDLLKSQNALSEWYRILNPDDEVAQRMIVVLEQAAEILELDLQA